MALVLSLYFKAVNRGKGLLPDPTIIQILTGLNNPATLKMLLNPLSQGNKQGNNNKSSVFYSAAVNPNVFFVSRSTWGSPHTPPAG